ARSGDAEFLIEALQEVFAWFFPDPEGAVTLDVGVATNRADTSTGFAEVALHELHIHDLFDRVHRLRLLVDSQSPSHDGGAGSGQQLTNVFNFFPAQPGRGFRYRPVEFSACLFIRVETFGAGINKLAVDNGAGIFGFLTQ